MQNNTPIPTEILKKLVSQSLRIRKLRLQLVQELANHYYQTDIMTLYKTNRPAYDLIMDIANNVGTSSTKI